MAGRTREEVVEWIGANYTLMDIRRLTEECNRRFGTEMTVGAVKNLKHRKGFRGAQPRVRVESKLFPPEIEGYILENHEGNGPKAMTEMLNGRFGTAYTTQQVKSYYGNHGINSGTDGRFRKGHTPSNKGMRMPPGTYEKVRGTMFKKGNAPHNTLGVGAEVKTKDGYIRVKVAEPNKWELKHRLIWRRAYGEIPDGYTVGFKDGDKANLSPDNLILMSRVELLELTRRGFRSQDPRVTEAGLAAVKLAVKCRELRKGASGG